MINLKLLGWLSAASLAIMSGIVLWAIVIHGPAQYTAGEKAESIAGVKRFNNAVKGLTDEADKAIALATRCRADGDKWLSGQRKCLKKGD